MASMSGVGVFIAVPRPLDVAESSQGEVDDGAEERNGQRPAEEFAGGRLLLLAAAPRGRARRLLEASPHRHEQAAAPAAPASPASSSSAAWLLRGGALLPRLLARLFILFILSAVRNYSCLRLLVNPLHLRNLHPLTGVLTQLPGQAGAICH